MTAAKGQIHCALFLFFLFIGLSDRTLAQEKIDVSNTREILISSVRESDLFQGQQKGDEALLITSRAEIAKFEALFNRNVQGKVHACGYHWRLTFYRAGAAPTEIFFNEKCEDFERHTGEICALVQGTFRRTVAHPNSYITNLDIDVNVLPEMAKDELTSKGRMRLLGLRDIARLPYVEIEASSTSSIPANRSLWNAEIAQTVQDADRALVNDIARIRARHHIVEIGEIMRGMSMFGGGKITEQRKVKLYFEVGSKLDDVGKGLNNSKVGSVVNPSEYTLQILSQLRPTKLEVEAMRKRFPFIKAVTPYQP
ncbi:MAG: hypothetical protein ABI481_02095 [Pyrinomonadaceae bacterium]